MHTKEQAEAFWNSPRPQTKFIGQDNEGKRLKLLPIVTVEEILEMDEMLYSVESSQ